MRWLILAGLALAGAAALWWVLAPGHRDGAGLLPYRDAATVALGQQVYAGHCAACHGAALQGQPDWRQADADGYLPAPPHDATGHTWHHADRQLVAITRLGTEQLVGGGYKSRMAGYADVLSEAEIIAVLAYIKSTWPPEIIDRHNQINADAALSGG
ncbi:cytochrome c [Seohaeicola saemankumensis]|nr:cytochrome c [Seohaeicola saemankumensis]MCA0872713.1 cytochrome c [Seohaeicola saemankumensis]